MIIILNLDDDGDNKDNIDDEKTVTTIITITILCGKQWKNSNNKKKQWQQCSNNRSHSNSNAPLFFLFFCSSKKKRRSRVFLYSSIFDADLIRYTTNNNTQRIRRNRNNSTRWYNITMRIHAPPPCGFFYLNQPSSILKLAKRASIRFWTSSILKGFTQIYTIKTPRMFFRTKINDLSSPPQTC